mgnify:CR=1 FL=1
MFAILVNQITREEGDIDKKIWVVFVVSMVIVATIKIRIFTNVGINLVCFVRYEKKENKKNISVVRLVL